uniref:Uncharacterized protein n=1 Tax=Rhipicephalus zambeziensis TaxID=60191 RepID=A0A224Y5E1_9ACAR
MALTLKNENMRAHNLWHIYYCNLYMQAMLAKFRMLWTHGTFLLPAHKQNTAIFAVYFMFFIIIYCIAGSVRWIMYCYKQSSVCLHILPNIRQATSDVLNRVFCAHVSSSFYLQLCPCATGYCVELHGCLLQL